MRWLISVGVGLILAGCGGATQTVTEPGTTVTVTGTPSATSTAPAAARPGAYHGNGTKSLGTITINTPSTIAWTCSGCAAFAFTSAPSGTTAIAISSNARSGTSQIAAGSYPNAQIISNGDWTITVTPQH